MPYEGYTAEEVARQGKDIYDRTLRHKIEATNKGKFLVIDVKSGDYEIAEEDIDASDRLLARRPDAVVFGLRIGYSAAYSLGAKLSAIEP